MGTVRARPATDLADLQSRPAGERLMLPPLTCIGHSIREIRYQGVEQTVYDYRFKADEKGLWEIEYSGRYHHGWDKGKVLHLVGTIHRHSARWRCTRIKRPVEVSPGAAPLFSNKDWLT